MSFTCALNLSVVYKQMFFIIHCTIAWSSRDYHSHKMYQDYTGKEHSDREVWFCSGKADAQVAGLREDFDLTYLSCIIDSCNLDSGMTERQLRNSLRCLCTEKQHMLNTNWKENTKPEESTLQSLSATQHSSHTWKGGPYRPHQHNHPLVRLWVSKLVLAIKS